MSSAVSSEVTSLTLMVDAHEKRDVAVIDVPGAYLHASMKDFVILCLEGNIVDYMVEACPEVYEPFVEIVNGKKVLYLQLLKALYGCVQSALLWYELFSSTLEKEGFVINPVEPCVANKIINGKVCTMLWYVDDVKISHVDEKIVSNVINMLEKWFGKLTINRGSLKVLVVVSNGHSLALSVGNQSPIGYRKTVYWVRSTIHGPGYFVDFSQQIHHICT